MNGVICVVAAIAMAAAATDSLADDFTPIGSLNPGVGTTWSVAWGISGNGATVVGESQDGSTTQAYIWTTTGIVGLGFLPGCAIPACPGGSTALAISSDGGTVVGSSDNGTGIAEAFRWTSGTGMVGLGSFIVGGYSEAAGVSTNGSVIVGRGEVSGGFEHAFRWTSGLGLVDLGVIPGTLPVNANSRAYGVSGDGAIVVGTSSYETAGILGSQAFRWTAGTGMVGLGFLGIDTASTAKAISNDGLTIVGTSGDAGGFTIQGQAFRWTAATGMVGLGFVPGDSQSNANAVNADGSVVVGASIGISGGHAFRWTAATGMQSIQDILTSHGVNLTGWQLLSGNGVSANGNVVTGNGFNPDGDPEAWIARFGATPGLITIDTLAQSLAGLGALGEAGNMYLDGTLQSQVELATQHRCSERMRQAGALLCGYVYGMSGTTANDVSSGSGGTALSGQFGIQADIRPGTTFGAGFGVGQTKAKMVFDGSGSIDAYSANGFLAYVPSVGPQFIAAVTAASLPTNITRGYLNGNTPAASAGSTKGAGYGAVMRVGYTFSPFGPLAITPFASYTSTTVHLSGWNESGGPFPAEINAIKDRARWSRIGGEGRWNYNSNTWLWGSFAAVHRYDTTTPDITGTVPDVISLTVPGTELQRNWVEANAGFRFPIRNNGVVTASVTVAALPHSAARLQERVGLSMPF